MNSDNCNNKPTKNEFEARLAGLYEEYFGKIAHYVYVRIGNRSEAEDIAGEVFLKALQSLKSYQERDIPMQNWLFRIAHNLTVDHLRKVSKRRIVSIDSLALPDNDNPVETVEKDIEFKRVIQAMEQLTVEQREIISLRFFGGLTSREVGNILNKSDGAVREMQRAALEKLRDIMGVER